MRLADRPLAVQFLAAGAIVAVSSLISIALLLAQVHQHTQVAHTLSEAEALSYALKHTFMAVAAINLGLLLIFAIVLGKLYLSIVRPIANLSQAMSHYQAGNLNVRIPISSRSQIGFVEMGFNEMGKRIESMVAELRKLDDLKSEFISTVSHELRTPLTSIGGYAKLVLSGDAGPITDTQREFLSIVDTNVLRLSHLINDILDVEKIESGKVQIGREPQDILPVLQECVTTLEVMAKQKGLALRFVPPKESVWVLGDRYKLIQIFMNLVSNAIKYTSTGQVKVEVESGPYAVAIKVIDSGVGLTEEDQQKLFQKFYRARSSLTVNEGGTGLGLVIARGLVEAHGGSISVESQPGVGSVFTVTLPRIADVGALSGSETQAQALAPVWSRSIWIIDDNDADVLQMRTLIESENSLFQNYQVVVRTFRSIHEVPEVEAHDQAPVMVILDPQELESRAIPELRKKLHESVSILIISRTSDAKLAFAEGASAWVSKPIASEPFRAAVRDLAGRKSSRILIADSNTDLRLLMKRALERYGFEVNDVERGNLVLSRLEQEYYDLALIDMNLPDLPTSELVKIIRKNSRFAALPIFVMSLDENSLPSAQELDRWGANQVIAKYRGLGAIVDSVRKYLEEKKLVEQHH